MYVVGWAVTKIKKMGELRRFVRRCDRLRALSIGGCAVLRLPGLRRGEGDREEDHEPKLTLKHSSSGYRRMLMASWDTPCRAIVSRRDSYKETYPSAIKISTQCREKKKRPKILLILFDSVAVLSVAMGSA